MKTSEMERISYFVEYSKLFRIKSTYKYIYSARIRTVHRIREFMQYSGKIHKDDGTQIFVEI